MKNLKKILIEKINRSDWWHVPPRDPNAYKKRGKFLASTYAQAEFYGRPNIEPEKVNISNPLFGFSHLEILENLFGKQNGKSFLKKVSGNNSYKSIIKLDEKMHNKAKQLNHDSIALMTKSGKNFLRKKLKPKSIELNLINL